MTDSTDVRHTPGPWQVIVDRHPHYYGGEHVERRIFTVQHHPQSKAPEGVVNMGIGVGPVEGGPPRPLVAIREADARLIAAAPDLLEALKGVIRVADRATVEFDAARAAIAKAEGTTP